jgi:hypothetical protein
MLLTLAIVYSRASLTLQALRHRLTRANRIPLLSRDFVPKSATLQQKFG